MQAALGDRTIRHIPSQGVVPVRDPGHEVGNDEPLSPTSDLTICWKVVIGRRGRRSLTIPPPRRRRQRLNLQPINGSTLPGGIQDRVDDLVGRRRRSGRSC